MSESFSRQFDYVILGGGSAGCTLANRLSADGKSEVAVVEAGKDYPPGTEPADIRSSYALGAAFNPAYHWGDLRVRLSHNPSNEPDRRSPRFMEQARVIGGGSSINAQMANRGSPLDYEEWEALGARGWGWDDVLPYFRKLETDQDIDDDYHGQDGPIPVRRVPEPEWTDFSRAVSQALTDDGLKPLPDQNGHFEDGWFACTISNKDEQRASAAMGFLDGAVRKRPNLHIVPETTVERLIFEGRRTVGARVRHGGETREIRGRRIVVSAGALHTPPLLMRSGVGPAGDLRDLGIEAVADRPGVGANLNEHPTLAVSAYLSSGARLLTPGRRHAHIAFRYTSGMADCGPGDMYVSVTAKSGWHPVGIRLGSFLMWCNKPYSRGRLKLASADPAAEPEVDFNMLSDRRDYDRLTQGMRRLAGYFDHPSLRRIARDPFPSAYSERVKKIGAVTTKNRILTTILAAIMDFPGPVRRSAIRNLITMGDTLAESAGRREADGGIRARERHRLLASVGHVPDGRGRRSAGGHRPVGRGLRGRRAHRLRRLALPLRAARQHQHPDHNVRREDRRCAARRRGGVRRAAALYPSGPRNGSPAKVSGSGSRASGQASPAGRRSDAPRGRPSQPICSM